MRSILAAMAREAAVRGCGCGQHGSPEARLAAGHIPQSRIRDEPGPWRARCSSGRRHRVSLRGSGGARPWGRRRERGRNTKPRTQPGAGRSSACPAQFCPPGVRERLATASCRAGPLTGHCRCRGPGPCLDCNPTALTPGRRWRGQRSRHKKHRAHLAPHFSNLSDQLCSPSPAQPALPRGVAGSPGRELPHGPPGHTSPASRSAGPVTPFGVTSADPIMSHFPLRLLVLHSRR